MVHGHLVISSSVLSRCSSSLAPTALADVVALLDALALAARGVGVGETLALLLGGEGRGLVGAGDVVGHLLALLLVSHDTRCQREWR